MAKLVTTAAERASASFLDWDDAALGAYCKQLALRLKGYRSKRAEKGRAEDNLGEVLNAADGMLLIGSMVEINAAKLELKFGDFTHAGNPAGDWEIRVRQMPKRKI